MCTVLHLAQQVSKTRMWRCPISKVIHKSRTILKTCILPTPPTKVNSDLQIWHSLHQNIFMNFPELLASRKTGGGVLEVRPSLQALYHALAVTLFPIQAAGIISVTSPSGYRQDIMKTGFASFLAFVCSLKSQLCINRGGVWVERACQSSNLQTRPSSAWLPLQEGELFCNVGLLVDKHLVGIRVLASSNLFNMIWVFFKPLPVIRATTSEGTATLASMFTPTVTPHFHSR